MSSHSVKVANLLGACKLPKFYDFFANELNEAVTSCWVCDPMHSGSHGVAAQRRGTSHGDMTHDLGTYSVTKRVELDAGGPGCFVLIFPVLTMD